MKNMIVEDENYWRSELSSLGIECKRKNELNDKEKLRALAMAIKESIFKITRLLVMITTHELTNYILSPIIIRTNRGNYSTVAYGFVRQLSKRRSINAVVL